MKAKCLLIFIFPFYSLFADDTVDQAETLRRELKFQEAVKLLEANRNQSLESRNLLALLYLDLNWLGKADAIYSELCERKPSYDCYLACGSLQMKMGGYVKAENQFRKALQIKKTSAAHSNLAVALFYQRNFTQSEEHHQKALQISPDNITAYTNFAIFLFTQKKYDESEIYFRNIHSADSGSFYAHLFLGRIYYIRKEYNKSLSELNQGIRINPSFFDLYYHRAAVHYRQRNKSAALSDLNTAIRLEPLNSRAVDFRNKIRKERN